MHHQLHRWRPPSGVHSQPSVAPTITSAQAKDMAKIAQDAKHTTQLDPTGHSSNFKMHNFKMHNAEQ